MAARIFPLIFVLFNLGVVYSEITNKTFPDNFMFGVATAAYQIEGGWNADGKGENIWDRFLHTRPYMAYRQANGDVACDSYHKYLDDVQMLQSLGVNHYRFSIAWSRILPTGQINRVNEAGVLYYKNLIAALKTAGVEPFVTLYHWDLPQPLMDLGGWPSPLLVDYFAEYARLAFTLFGDDVKYWMTFNEPMQICQSGYGFGISPPGYIANGIGPYLCAHTVIKAHAKAYHIYNEEFRATQNGKVSIVVDSYWYEPGSDSDDDKEAAERIMQFKYGWYAHPIYHPDGNYPQVMIDRIANRSSAEGFKQSRLPEFTPDEVDYIKGTFDFLCLNTYTTNYVKWSEEATIGYPSSEADISVATYTDPDWKGSTAFWLKIVPWGMRKLLNWVDKEFNHPEIFITENGYSDDGTLDDDTRINYIQEYLSNILDAMLEDNINVTGYTLWTLMDNFEWNMGYANKFGLYYVDFDDVNRTRTPKKSADYYKKIITTRCLLDECEQ